MAHRARPPDPADGFFCGDTPHPGLARATRAHEEVSLLFHQVVLARLGSAEMAAIAGGVVFAAIVLFFLFWGGPPTGERRR